MSQDDLYYMQLAIEQARIAFNCSEVPVGAVIVKNNQLISSAGNQTEKDVSALAHAEILSISKASKSLDNWRLNDCRLYVTLEPCLMCLGAILNSRISRIVFGAREPRFGALYSNRFIDTQESIYKDLTVTEGVLADECSTLIKDFFKSRRQAAI